MEFTKEVNNFGVFGNVVLVDNCVVISLASSKIETKEEALMLAAHLTATAIKHKVDNKEIHPIEGILISNDAAETTDVTVVTPNIKDIKLFTEAVIKTAEDGNMCHMKDYVHETGSNIPQEIWDYIYKLTNDK